MRRAVGLLAAVALLVLAQGRSEAGVILSIQQVGSDVVATWDGTINLAALTPLGPSTTLNSLVAPNAPSVNFNPGPVDNYTGNTGPANFGPGGYTLTTSFSGDSTGVHLDYYVVVPQGYVSNTSLSASMTFANTTLNGLGITPGIYTWTWGSGATADSIVLYAGVPVPQEAPVPEPASLALLGLGAAGLLAARRRRRG